MDKAALPTTETLIGYLPFVVGTRPQPASEPAVIVSRELLDAPRPAPAVAREPATHRTALLPIAPRPAWIMPAVIGGCALAVTAVVTVLAWPAPHRSSRTIAASAPALAPAAAKPAAPPIAPPSVVALPPPPAPIEPPTRAAANAVTTIDGGSCSLHVDASATGSVVMVDGHVIAEAPVQVDGVYCGRRARVTVANPHFATWERWIIPEEGKQSRVRAELQRAMTAVAVTSSPGGAIVRINGRDITTTPAGISLAADVETRIDITMPGYATFTRWFVPHAGAATTIDASLLMKPTPH